MKYIKLFESFKTFYHGSNNPLPIGTILKPHKDSYTKDPYNKDLEDILEKYRPEDKLSRFDSVFISDDINLIDPSGGYVDYIFEVKPIGKVESSDLAWYTEVQLTDDPIKQKEFSLKYWSGEKHSDKRMSCVEYRCNSAEIMEMVETN